MWSNGDKQPCLEVPRPSRRVLSGVPDMRARCATRPPLPQILPPQTPIDEVPPFPILVLHGWQDRQGRMTLMEGVFSFHRSLTPTARETFFSFLSHVFVPSPTSFLILLVFCSVSFGCSFLLSTSLRLVHLPSHLLSAFVFFLSAFWAVCSGTLFVYWQIKAFLYGSRSYDVVIKF